MLRKPILTSLINLLLLVNIFGQSQNTGSFSTYFPLEIGNEWRYETFYENWADGPTSRIIDTTSVSGHKYFLFSKTNTLKNDTVRMDKSGRVWKYNNNQEQIWLDFTTDTTYYFYDYYGQYNIIDTFEVTPKKYLKIDFGLTTYDSCISFWFDSPKVFDEEKDYLFLPGIGLGHIYYHTPATGAYRDLYAAMINNRFYGNDRIFHPSFDTLLINFDFPPPSIRAVTNIKNNLIDEIIISPGEDYNTYFMMDDYINTHSFIDECQFIVYDSLNTFEYVLWYEPVQPHSTWDTLHFQIPLDTVCTIEGYPFGSGVCQFKLYIYEHSTCIDSIVHPVKIRRIGMAIEHNPVPSKYHLYQNYPNPFNPTTTIAYILPKKSYVKITIYDLSGRLIETLVDAEKFTGFHQVNWYAGKYSSGIYFYKIETDNFVDFKKCLLVK